MLACWQPFPRLALIMSGAYCVACTSGGRDPNQRSAINSRWAILPQLGDRDLGGRHDTEARSDFLGEE